jgi:hypothetical protein
VYLLATQRISCRFAVETVIQQVYSKSPANPRIMWFELNYATETEAIFSSKVKFEPATVQTDHTINNKTNKTIKYNTLLHNYGNKHA